MLQYQKWLKPSIESMEQGSTMKNATFTKYSALRRQKPSSASSWKVPTIRLKFTLVKHWWSILIWTNMVTLTNKEIQRICWRCSGFIFKINLNIKSISMATRLGPQVTFQLKNSFPILNKSIEHSFSFGHISATWPTRPYALLKTTIQ